MKLPFLLIACTLASLSTQAQTTSAQSTDAPISEMLPMVFMAILAYMLLTAIRYFLDFRIKNKLIERGIAEHLTSLLATKDAEERKNDALKYALLFVGTGAGFLLAYFTAPLNLHSLAIMALSIGISYLAYYRFLKK